MPSGVRKSILDEESPNDVSAVSMPPRSRVQRVGHLVTEHPSNKGCRSARLGDSNTGATSIRSSWYKALQRLFSTFPNSWPGVGLLLLRSCLGITLICFGIAGLAAKSSETITFPQTLLTFMCGIFLLAGLWTPVIGGLIALGEAWKVLSLHSALGGAALIHIFLAVLAVSVAMLGPGAWSIDARLFGRKRFDIDRTRGRRSLP